jgi:hypothetical protein
MRSLLSVLFDGLAPLPESLVAIDATRCTKSSASLDVHVLDAYGVASIGRGVVTAAPHKLAHHFKKNISQTRAIHSLDR